MSDQKTNGNTTQVLDYEFPQYEKQTVKQFFYNSKDGSYLGRTPKNWGQICLFYVVFYTVLAGLFAICLQGLFSTLSDTEPRWKLNDSLIGSNPGLGYRPLSDDVKRGSVIQFDTKKPKEGQYWKNLLDEFLQQYNGTESKREKYCNYNHTFNPNEVCVVDVNSFGPCSPQEEYGYKNGRPCVLLKLNKIYGWDPIYYDDPNDLPEDMPAELKQHIAKTPWPDRKQVWISCEGQHAIDNENIGTMSFYPSRGFRSYYYPYLNQPGYLSPLIAVQFEKLTINQMINVECRAWAKNIVYSRSANLGRMGSVIFQLFID